MRQSPIFALRTCELCGCEYAPSGATQRYCIPCRSLKSKERKKAWEAKKYPNRKPKRKSSEVCCVCGAPFSSHFSGNAYCNVHYLRMYNNGTVEKLGRQRTNTYSVQGDIVTVTTSKGKPFLVDVADLEKVRRYSWCYSKTGYLVANINHRVVKLHRYLLEPEVGVVIDHINGDPADNRRCNLRICSNAENCRNCKPSKNSKTGVVGVKIKKNGNFSAYIMVNRKYITLGCFHTLEEAAKARKEAEIRYFGEFAPTLSRTSTTTRGVSE